MTARSLIVVESPSKARTIERYLGRQYRVLACNGHVKDLPENELGVDIARKFRPKYVILPGRYKIIKKIKETARRSPSIFIATDPDREGEAIAWHIVSELNGDSNKIKRVLFTEITPAGIKAGMENPRGVDRKLVDAQQARRIIDRIVGYDVSKFLWSVLYDGLSAGRVQSVALRLVCERHNEIINFQPREYWTIDVELKSQSGEVFSSRLHHINGKKPEIPTAQDAQEIVATLEGQTFRVISMDQKDVQRKPYPPFITSTLQQEAARRLHLSPARTMRIAQKLYEGVDLDQREPSGLITYMRTDSTRVSDLAVRAVRKYISAEIGSHYLPPKALQHGQKKKLVQGAHEAIRPTNPTRTPEALKGKLQKDELALYRLVWQRFVASQMSPLVLAQTVIDISAGVEKGRAKYLFRTVGSTVKFDGFRKVYPPAKKTQEVTLPRDLTAGEELEVLAFNPEQHFTKPPPYFTESSLIKELDTRGIGRPSTFAETVSRLYKRKYVAKQKGKLIPTETGLTVNNILTSNLPAIFNVGFTARMEEELDEIESGKQCFLEVMNDFYKPFRISMQAVRERRQEIKSSLVESTAETCEKCGSPMVIKWNRRGEKFLACSGFPKCRSTKSLAGDGAERKILERICPECGAQLEIRSGRFGRYVGCTGYPDCRHSEPLSTGVACPKTGCEGEIVERTSKKKKVFYGCSRYPDCDYVSGHKPLLYHCQQCGNHFVEERRSKKRRTYYACPNCKKVYRTLGDELHRSPEH